MVSGLGWLYLKKHSLVDPVFLSMAYDVVGAQAGTEKVRDFSFIWLIYCIFTLGMIWSVPWPLLYCWPLFTLFLVPVLGHTCIFLLFYIAGGSSHLLGVWAAIAHKSYSGNLLRFLRTVQKHGISVAVIANITFPYSGACWCGVMSQCN